MSWFFFAAICLLGWGLADLFYKCGSEEADRNSPWKIAVWVGLVMGAVSLVLLPFSETLTAADFLKNAFYYLPASLSYILSMVIGYVGLRYLELSIVSPIQNASGALSALCMLIWFFLRGKIGAIGEIYTPLDLAGTLLIVLGIVGLSVAENRLARRAAPADQKHQTGAWALIFPLLYCVFDTIGTAADGVILDETSGLSLGEFDVLVLYGFTFFLFGLAAWVILWVREKHPYQPFQKSERPKAAAAVCEQFGQIFYVFAMASNPVLAAPTVASYCIVSLILSRLFLKEKLKVSQWIPLIAVVIGILFLGIAEGLAEA